MEDEKNNNYQYGSPGDYCVWGPSFVSFGFKAVSAGLSRSYGIDREGVFWAWGNNCNGQLGDGTRLYRSRPVKIMTGVKTVASGGCHCMAVKKDGSLWS